MEGWGGRCRQKGRRTLEEGNGDVVSERCKSQQIHSQQIQSAGCAGPAPVSAAVALTNGMFSKDLIRGKWAFICSPTRSASRTEK